MSGRMCGDCYNDGCCDGLPYCGGLCFTPAFRRCAACGGECRADDMEDVGGGWLCETCAATCANEKPNRKEERNE